MGKRCLAAALVLAVLTAAPLSACQHRPQVQGLTNDTPAATPTVDPSVAAAGQQVIELYQNYLRAIQQANKTADYNLPDLRTYLGDPLRSEVVSDLFGMHSRGQGYAGQLGSTPTVKSVDLAAKPPAVTIRDCFDATNYHLVYMANQSPVPVAAGNRRYIAEYVATRQSDGRWLFTDAHTYRDQTC